MQFFHPIDKGLIYRIYANLLSSKMKGISMAYKQLTLEKRYHISALKKLGYKQNYIAKKIGVNPSTISRELKRNSDTNRVYNAELAQVKTFKRPIANSKKQSTI